CRRTRLPPPGKSARCSAAPSIWRSRRTARARRRGSRSSAARPCTSPAARDTIRALLRADRAGGAANPPAYLPHLPHLPMIDFSLNDEQRLLEQSVREWAAREVAPRIHDLDREHRFDRRILPQMASLGLLGISVPQEYGG